MNCRASATWRDNLYDELVIDNFAGGGGAGLGIELAIVRANIIGGLIPAAGQKVGGGA